MAPAPPQDTRDSLWRRVWHRLLVFERPVLWAVGVFFKFSMHVFIRLTTVDRRGPFWGYVQRREPCIVTYWHEDVFSTGFELLWHARKSYPCYAMMSAGRVGRAGGYLFELFNIPCVYGSRKQTGVEAVNQLIEMVNREPRAAIVAADGSRGPSREARWGALHLARETGLPIVPVRGWCEQKVVLKNTWMKIALPMPWGRRVILSADSLLVPADADKEKLEWCRAELEQRMNEMADASVAYFEDGTEAAARWGEPVQITALRR